MKRGFIGELVWEEGFDFIPIYRSPAELKNAELVRVNIPLGTYEAYKIISKVKGGTLKQWFERSTGILLLYVAMYGQPDEGYDIIVMALRNTNIPEFGAPTSAYATKEVLYDNYAKALNFYYWQDKGIEILRSFSEDFERSFSDPLKILKSTATKLAIGEYGKAELVAKEIGALTSTITLLDISTTLGFAYSYVGPITGYYGQITNASAEMENILLLIRSGKYVDARRKIFDLINYLKVAKEQVDKTPMTISNVKEFVKKIFDSAIDFLLGEFYSFADSETSLTLRESTHKLYLHVYDEHGRHVRANYDTNRTEIGIPGSYYLDLNGKIIIVLPLNVTSFHYIVDARYALAPVENYTLTITTFKRRYSHLRIEEKRDY